MGLRFRQSFQLFPGVRLNVGRRGVSASFGLPGATLNLSSRGLRGTVGIPSSGISYSTMLVGPPRRATSPAPVLNQSQGWPGSPSIGFYEPKLPSGPTPQPMASAGPKQAYVPMVGMREIGSASVEALTSAGLLELRDMIFAARQQRTIVEQDLREARSEHDTLSVELDKRSLFRFFYKRRIAELTDKVPQAAAETERLQAWNETTHIDIDFEIADATQRAYASLLRSFEALKGNAAKWDVTSDRDANRVVERTLASRTIARHPVALEYTSSELIRFSGQAMKFSNVNGEDILIYPGMALVPRGDGMFALIDLRDMKVSFRASNFVEDERVPEDARVVGQTWAKVNKDGSPDRRFKDNYQIPVCLYGQLVFTSTSGMTEEFMFSNAEAAQAFALAFEIYQAALAS